MDEETTKVLEKGLFRLFKYNSEVPEGCTGYTEHVNVATKAAQDLIKLENIRRESGLSSVIDNEQLKSLEVGLRRLFKYNSEVREGCTGYTEYSKVATEAASALIDLERLKGNTPEPQA